MSMQEEVEIRMERIRQDKKWGRHFPGRPHSHWSSILVEEVGEAAEQINMLEVDPRDGTGGYQDLYDEVVQIAASALAWLELGEWEEGTG